MGNKEDDDDDDDDGNDDDKFDGFSGDPERLKAFNVSIYILCVLSLVYVKCRSSEGKVKIK